MYIIFYLSWNNSNFFESPFEISKIWPDHSKERQKIHMMSEFHKNSLSNTISTGGWILENSEIYFFQINNNISEQHAYENIYLISMVSIRVVELNNFNYFWYDMGLMPPRKRFKKNVKIGHLPINDQFQRFLITTHVSFLIELIS